jgi:hypothetical protein
MHNVRLASFKTCKEGGAMDANHPRDLRGSLVCRKASMKLNKVGYPRVRKSCMAHLSFSPAASHRSCSSCLRCSLSSSCFLNPSAASRARRAHPKRVSSSWVTSLATLRRLGTGVWPSTKPAKLMTVLTGVGSGCNGVRKMSRRGGCGVRAGVW